MFISFYLGCLIKKIFVTRRNGGSADSRAEGACSSHVGFKLNDLVIEFSEPVIIYFAIFRFIGKVYPSILIKQTK
jgi:hypothetical protein